MHAPVIRTFKLAAGLLVLFLCTAVPASAADCSLSVTGMNFGRVESQPGRDPDTIGFVLVSCRGQDGPEISITLSLDIPGEKAMRDGAQSLAYELYVDPGFQQPWGDGTAGTQAIQRQVPNDGSPVRVPIYGRLRVHQRAIAGQYTDRPSIRLDY